jgi:hypothetical protein
MENYPYIVSDQSATLIYEGKPYTLSSSQPNFTPFKKALVQGDFETAIGYLDIKTAIKNWSDGELRVDNSAVYYYSERLHGTVVDKLLELLQAGMSRSAPFIKFIKNLLDNPSKSSVDELYDFLSYKSLPIDEDGWVIGYKGVASDGWSISGNTQTTVLQGEVNDRGQILNRVGDTIEVQRRCVDDDRRNNCSHGLHVGSFDYAKSWAGSGKLLMVRFNPADAVSVPEDCSCQKLRVSKYEILEEIEIADDSEVEKPFYGVYTDGNTEEENDYNYDYDDEEYED